MFDSVSVEIREAMDPKVLSLKKRQTYYIRLETIEKLKAYAYWERKGISEVVNVALQEFLKDWEIRKIPRRRKGALRQDDRMT